MSSSPFAGVVKALSYAAARDFAQLAAVKDLRTLVASAIARAKGQVPASRLEALRAVLPELDSSDLERRKIAVRQALKMASDDATAPEGPTPAGRSAPPPSTERRPRAAGGRPSVAPSSVGSTTRTGESPLKRERSTSTPSRSGETSPGESPKRARAVAPSALPPFNASAPSLAQPLKSVGWRLNPRLVAALNKRQLTRLGDVLFLIPRQYEDRRQMQPIARLRHGERGTIIAEVRRVEDGFRGRRAFRAVLGDATGTIAVTYFQSGPWLKAKFPLGKKLVVSGEVRQSSYGWEIAHPEVEPADDADSSPIHFNRIVPVYAGFERHEQRQMRELIYKILHASIGGLVDPLPEALRSRNELLPLATALTQLHFPLPETPLEELDAHVSPAHRRLAFDELFFLQLGLALRRQGAKVEAGISFSVTSDVLARAKAMLPFTMTGAQDRVLTQLAGDMARGEPMNRLVQGDVGSGKTAVAAAAAAIAIQSGYQVAVMAPTELLAEQHHRTFSAWLTKLGATAALVTGTGSAASKRAQRSAVESGRAALAVGTHALVEGATAFAKLGLVIIDEQHRFGVMQRHALMAKGERPDVLVMTATPIPRTLAMTLYGDLDVSVIDELPPGRTPIETRVYREKSRPAAYELVREQLAKGQQAYVVYPLVEESEKSDLADATQGAEQLRTVFPQARIGLLHGRLKPAEKDAVMESFRARELDLLVATTVVEVGVDVPNASVMLIEHAERFGLSQLHQLRGRVGRGAAKSWCLLLAAHASSEEARARLDVMASTSDGFVIAEKDLELRGPGEFLGTRQSGVPELAVANLVRDQALLSIAQQEARSIVEQDPQLTAPSHQGVVRALEVRWAGRLKLARVG